MSTVFKNFSKHKNAPAAFVNSPIMCGQYKKEPW